MRPKRWRRKPEHERIKEAGWISVRRLKTVEKALNRLTKGINKRGKGLFGKNNFNLSHKSLPSVGYNEQ